MPMLPVDWCLPADFWMGNALPRARVGKLSAKGQKCWTSLCSIYSAVPSSMKAVTEDS